METPGTSRRLNFAAAGAMFMLLAAATRAGTGANAELFDPRLADGLPAGEGPASKGASVAGPGAVTGAARGTGADVAYSFAEGRVDGVAFSNIPLYAPYGYSCDAVRPGLCSGHGANCLCNAFGLSLNPRMTSMPGDPFGVDVFYGDYLAGASDLEVALTGRDFQIIRSYTSDPDYDGAGLVGEHWAASPFMFLTEVPVEEDEPLLVLAGPPMRELTFVHDGGTKWVAGGPTAQYIIESTLAVGGNTYATYRLIEPGAYRMDFYRPHAGGGGITATPATHEGLLLKERDNYSNTLDYEYTVYGTSLSSDKHHARLTTITCLSGDSSPAEEAEIQFTWQDDDTEPEKGRLLNVKVMRDPAGTPFETQRVVYTYKADGDGLSDALGTENDLIEVRRYVRLDDSSGDIATWRLTVTQYRYHAGLANEETDDDGDGFIEVGGAHQLKSIFMPEQMEYFAQAFAEDADSASYDTVSECAPVLLTLDDEDEWYSGSISTVVDLAASVISEYEDTADGRVAMQFVQSTCGCGGTATQGLRLDYTHYDFTHGSHDNGDIYHTMKLEELYWNGAAWAARKDVYFDSGPPEEDGVPYLQTVAVVIGSDEWVVHQKFDETTRNLTHIFSAEATDSYTPVVPGTPDTPPVYAAEAAIGLVKAFEYSSENRLEAVRMDEGDQGAVTNFTKVLEVTYGNGSGSTRTHLPNKVERFRVAGSSSANDVETIDYTYSFHTSNAIEWMEVEPEAELEAENGPNGTYSRYEVFDVAGRNIWTRAEDKAMTKRAFQSGTGEVETLTLNASTSGLPGLTGLSTGSWGRNGDGGKLETTYTRDKAGRVIKTTSPGAVITYVRREMQTFAPFRPDLEYYAVVALPHIINNGSALYGGPANVAVLNAAGAPIGVSDWSLSTNGITLGSGLATAYSLSAELTRTVTVHDVTGVVNSQSVWNDVANDYEDVSTFLHDELGRRVKVTSSTGTITRYTFDDLDRLDTVQIGTSDPANMTLVEERFYDSAGTDTSGVGNGNLTLIRKHADGSNERDTVITYDYRNQAVITENPSPPHSYAVYDNLGRMTEHAVFESVPVDIDDPLADRGRYTTTAYSQRGTIYRTRTAIDATSGSPTFLENHSWFDENGRTIASWPHSAPGTKTTFDGLGRAKTVFITDRRSDAATGAASNHANAASVTGDVIIEQRTDRYITDEGLLDLVTERYRAHDATTSDTGDLSGLSSAKSIVTYSGRWYDDANRLIRSVEYGTNDSTGWVHGGSAPTITQGSPPDPDDADDTKLVTKTEYNSRGLVDVVTDPMETKTKTYYDDANRRIAVVENYVNAAVTWSGGSGRWTASGLDFAAQDEDRVSSCVYDGVGHITKMVAHLPKSGGGEDVQETHYVYGVSKGGGTGDSDIASFDLLKEIRYPNEGTGVAGTTDEYKVKRAYNRLGELKWMQDQIGDSHAYTLDGAGRVTADVVTFDGGSPADQTIDAITTTYDDFGRREFVRSRDGGAAGTIKNAVKFTYTPLWQVLDLWQDHNGDVDTGGGGSDSRKVTYTYTNSAGSSDNYSRVTTITYPDANAVNPSYGAAGDPSDKISRVEAIKEGVGTFVAYSFIGMSMPAIVDYPTPDVILDTTVDYNGARTAGEYIAYDQYGRVYTHNWCDGGLTTHGSSGSVPNIPFLERYGYTWDNNGNVTGRYYGQPGAKPADGDEEYSYDGLDRLAEATRGVRAGSWTPTVGSQKWELDSMGNWLEYSTDGNGDGDYLDTYEMQRRDHNFANEFTLRYLEYDPTSFEEIGTYYDEEVAWTDANGLSTWEQLMADPQPDSAYVYDAWQRLVAVTISGELRAEYEYNGLNWRIVSVADTDQDSPNFTLDQRRIMYYDNDWRLLEERINDNDDVDSTIDRIGRYVWGVRHLDDLVARDMDRNADGDIKDVGDARYFAITDRNFSVIGIIDDTGALIERVRYTPYGEARHRWAHDTDEDGDVDTDDDDWAGSVPITSGGFQADRDIDRDGDNDSTDRTAIAGSFAAALDDGMISAKSTAVGVDSHRGFAGAAFSLEAHLYDAEATHYSPNIGIWLGRPVGDHTSLRHWFGSAYATTGGNFFHFLSRSAERMRPNSPATSPGERGSSNLPYDPNLGDPHDPDGSVITQPLWAILTHRNQCFPEGVAPPPCGYREFPILWGVFEPEVWCVRCMRADVGRVGNGWGLALAFCQNPPTQGFRFDGTIIGWQWYPICSN